MGRPVEAGNNGELSLIGAEGFGRKVAVDLISGVILIDYESIGIQNGTTEITNPKTVMYICEETNRLFDFMNMTTSEPDENGNVINTFTPLQWRPISFTRHTYPGGPTLVVGTQVTLPELQGGKNIKKLVSIFMDGSIGID